MMGKISVIVPVYNVAPYLGQCVESILSQTYQNIEVFLIDDGSKDDSGEICDRFKSDERVRTIHKENGGVTAARETAFALVTGEWVSFIDADDWVDPEMLETMLSTAMERNADIVCCRMTDASPEGHWCREYDQEAATQALLEGALRNSLCNKLYRAKVIQGIHIPADVRYAEDLLFNYYAFQRSQKVVSLSDRYYHYVKHEDSCTKAAVRELHFDSLKVSQILLEEEKRSKIVPYVVARNIRTDFAALTRIICGNAFWEYFEPIKRDILNQKWNIVRGKLPLNSRYKLQTLLLWLFPGGYKRILKLIRKA